MGRPAAGSPAQHPLELRRRSQPRSGGAPDRGRGAVARRDRAGTAAGPRRAPARRHRKRVRHRYRRAHRHDVQPDHQAARRAEPAAAATAAGLHHRRPRAGLPANDHPGPVRRAGLVGLQARGRPATGQGLGWHSGWRRRRGCCAPQPDDADRRRLPGGVLAADAVRPATGEGRRKLALGPRERNRLLGVPHHAWPPRLYRPGQSGAARTRGPVDGHQHRQRRHPPLRRVGRCRPVCR